MLIAEFKGEVQNRTFMKDGQQMAFTDLVVYVNMGDAYPTKVVIGHDRQQPVPAQGKYLIPPTSFETNRYGGLQISRRPELLPFAEGSVLDLSTGELKQNRASAK